MKKKLTCFDVRNESTTSADVYIHGDVIDDEWKAWMSDYDGETFAGYVLPVDVREKLESLQGKDLTIYINSDGGSVLDGWAASIASVIFMACDELYMPKNTFLMIHKPSAMALGNADDMLRVATMLDTVQDGIEQTYLERAREGVTPEAIHDAVETETWYTAAEAAEMFDITVEASDVQLVACSKSVNFKSMPDAVRAAKTADDTAANGTEELETRKRRLAIELELLK